MKNVLSQVQSLVQHVMPLIQTLLTVKSKYTMIDTAGMRKSGKVYENTEKYSVMRSMRAIDRSDIVLMVINAEEGIREYDKRIAGFAHEAGKVSSLLSTNGILSRKIITLLQNGKKTFVINSNSCLTLRLSCISCYKTTFEQIA